jgi:catechol 2,3-dioxygenase-like lactoylglutathione lyase family enzyme
MQQNALLPELAVTDAQASLRFYRDILGFALEYERIDEGFAFLSMGDNQLMLDQVGVGRDWKTGALEFPLGRGINLQMRVDHLDPILARLREAGIPLFLPLETRTYAVGCDTIQQRQFCVQDPDGYLLRFCE